MRWVGGKGKNIERFTRYLPEGFENMFYVEPFAGSAAMMIAARPGRALLSDINGALMNVYEALVEFPIAVIESLSEHDRFDSETYYYRIRNEFNEMKRRVHSFGIGEDVRLASDFLYLNARCFNGLYRENSKGDMNSPYAKDLKGMKKVCNPDNMMALSSYLNDHVTVLSVSYEDTLPIALTNPWYQDIFYFMDPPYYPLSATASFTRYGKDEWKDDDFVKLRRFCDRLNEEKILFLLCNHDVPFIRKVFEGYHFTSHMVTRSVSCKARERPDVAEIVITNYHVTSQVRVF